MYPDDRNLFDDFDTQISPEELQDDNPIDADFEPIRDDYQFSSECDEDLEQDFEDEAAYQRFCS